MDKIRRILILQLILLAVTLFIAKDQNSLLKEVNYLSPLFARAVVLSLAGPDLQLLDNDQKDGADWGLEISSHVVGGVKVLVTKALIDSRELERELEVAPTLDLSDENIKQELIEKLGWTKSFKRPDGRAAYASALEAAFTINTLPLCDVGKKVRAGAVTVAFSKFEYIVSVSNFEKLNGTCLALGKPQTGTDGGFYQLLAFAESEIEQAGREFGVTDDHWAKVYSRMIAKWESDRVELPILTVSVRKSDVAVTLSLLSFILLVWVSFRLRQLVSNQEAEIDKIIAVSVCDPSYTSGFDLFFTWVERLIIGIFYTLALFAPVCISSFETSGLVQYLLLIIVFSFSVRAMILFSRLMIGPVQKGTVLERSLAYFQLSVVSMVIVVGSFALHFTRFSSIALIPTIVYPLLAVSVLLFGALISFEIGLNQDPACNEGIFKRNLADYRLPFDRNWRKLWLKLRGRWAIRVGLLFEAILFIVLPPGLLFGIYWLIGLSFKL